MTDTAVLPSSEDEFREHLQCLSPSKLRERYHAEASCHANIKRRVKRGECEIDPSWESFRTFLSDMGPRPGKGYTIDRVDNATRRYGPGLCRWATAEEQTRNRSNTKWLDVGGERVTAGEFAQKIGISYSTLHSALARGEAPEDIEKRFKSRGDKAGVYVPSSADTLARRDAFENEYKRWSKGVKRPDRRKLLSREAFQVARVALLFERVQHVRAKQADLAYDDAAEFELKYEQQLRVLRNALTWAQEAAKRLAASNVQFAAEIYPRSEEELIRRGWLYDWFQQPSDD